MAKIRNLDELGAVHQNASGGVSITWTDDPLAAFEHVGRLCAE